MKRFDAYYIYDHTASKTHGIVLLKGETTILDWKVFGQS